MIDIAQLHGLETDEYISQLKSMTGDREVWKVFELGSVIDDSEKLNETLKMATDSKADRILFDSGKGSGVAFDRHVLDNFKKELYSCMMDLHLRKYRSLTENCHMP